MNIAEAAKVLGMSQQSLRLWIQSDRCPFGVATKRFTKWNYHIYETRLNVWINGEDIKKSATGSAGSALSD